MENNKPEFIPLSEKMTTSHPAKKVVIKGDKIRHTHSKLVNIHNDDIIENSSEIEEKLPTKIEPIFEQDTIVGIIHICKCGEKSEIRFDKDTKEKPEDKNNIES
jgi:hypothetical protein